MNLRYLSDNQLIQATDKLVVKEREILTEVLHHLKEIDRRRLFSSLGFKSLFDYCVRKLHYSEAQAYRRITAMRLIKQMPELEEKISSGSLNLSHLGLAQSLFKREQLTQMEKVEVLSQLENTPAREAQKIVLSLSSNPQCIIPERSKQVTSDLSQVSFSLRNETRDKIEYVKGLLAHSNPNMSMDDLLNKLCDMAIEVAMSKKSRIIKEVFAKANYQCGNCQSTYALEIDHIIPKAKGGTDDPENLRTLCRSCNQRAAIKEFGLHKISDFINKQSRTK